MGIHALWYKFWLIYTHAFSNAVIHGGKHFLANQTNAHTYISIEI